MHEQKHERKRVFSSFSNRKFRTGKNQKKKRKEKRKLTDIKRAVKFFQTHKTTIWFLWHSMTKQESLKLGTGFPMGKVHLNLCDE